MDRGNPNQELRQGLDNDVLALDLQDVFRAKEKKEKKIETKNCQSVLAGLQDVVSTGQRRRGDQCE